MSLRLKNIIYTLVLLLAVFLVWKYRQGKQQPMIAFNGTTMGPIMYHVKYFDKEKRNFKHEVDSLLKRFNQALSTYIPDSEISRFNSDTTLLFESPFFYPVLECSKNIYELTDGAYDPTVMPLVNAWGFGPDKGIPNDSTYIDSLMQFIGFDKIMFNRDSVSKKDPRVQLDFSASAKGYGVDLVAGFLQNEGINNLFVEIGGEVVAKGKNLQKDQVWQVGILDPKSDEINRFYKVVVGLKDKAMATSGNYFNYRTIDGVKYSHTINPATGYPVVHPLLSASVFAENCMTADALATAFMVLGHDEAIELLKGTPAIDAFLIYNDESGNVKTYTTKGIKPFIKRID